MADATLAHICLLLPAGAHQSSETNTSSPIEIASTAALMAYMELHPNDFLREDTKKIFTSILHESLFAFNDQTNHSDFPLVLRMVSSLSASEQATARHESDDVLSKMAQDMLTYVREKGNTTNGEANVLEEMGRVKAELQSCRDRLVDLEQWKEDRQLIEQGAKVEQETAEKSTKATITLLTVEKALIGSELQAKSKELAIARNVVDALRKSKPSKATIQTMQERHEKAVSNLVDEHNEELFKLESQLFDAEQACRNLEMEVSLLTSINDSDELADDNSGSGAGYWKERYESAMREIGAYEQKPPADVRFEGQQLEIDDLRSQVTEHELKIEQLLKKLTSLSLELVKMHAESANHAVETTKLKNEITNLTEIVELRESQMETMESNLRSNRERTQKLQGSVADLNTAQRQSSMVIKTVCVGRALD